MTNRDIPGDARNTGQAGADPGSLIADALARLAPRYRPVIVMGLALIVMGSAGVAIIGMSRTLSLTPVGGLMALGALLELGVAHHARGTDGRSTPWHTAGVLTIFAALGAIAYTLLPSMVFTTFTGAALAFAGWARLRATTLVKLPGKSAIVPISASATILLGVLIVTRWAAGDIAATGYLIALSIIMTGWGYVGLGVTLRRLL